MGPQLFVRLELKHQSPAEKGPFINDIDNCPLPCSPVTTVITTYMKLELQTIKVGMRNRKFSIMPKKLRIHVYIFFYGRQSAIQTQISETLTQADSLTVLQTYWQAFLTF